MRTQVMHERAAGLPWLEHYPVDGGSPQQTALDSFPFVIGRNEDSDLTIDSSRISRRHAEVLCTGDGYRLRDLGSTNGTFLNGQPIDEAPLQDGDLFVVADLELTFFAGRTSEAPDMATQAIDFGVGFGAGSETSWEFVRAVRRLDEVLAHRAIEIRYVPIVELESERAFAYRVHDTATPSAGGTRSTEESILKTDCRLSSRYRRLKRTLAVEQATRLAEGVHVFLKLDEVEIGDETLAESLEELARTLPAARRLVTVVPHRDVSDAAYFHDLFGRLRSAGIRLAYDGVAEPPTAIVAQPPLRPDYLILTDGATEDLARNLPRQQQLESIVRAGREGQSALIATGLTRREDADFCRRLGCRFGQGELFAYAAPAPSTDGCLTG